MKKQILKTAVVAAIVLPMAAQAGIYGRADGVLYMNDDETTIKQNGVVDTVRSTEFDQWDIAADKFRWGIVGSEDLGNGMKALYQYEFDMASGDSVGGNGSRGPGLTTRLAYAGLEGSWGKVTIGRNWLSDYSVWAVTDTGDAHADFGQANISGNRSGNMLQYSSPNMSGFTVHVDLNIDDGDANHGNSDSVDWYTLTAKYKNGPLQLGATYRDAELGPVDCVDANGTTVTTATSCDEYDRWAISGKYTFGDLTVSALYGTDDNEVYFGTTGFFFDEIETDIWAIGAVYKMGNTHIHGAYRNNDQEWSGRAPDRADQEIEDWYIGVTHFMSKETRVLPSIAIPKPMPRLPTASTQLVSM